MFIAVGGASLPRLRRTNNPLNPPCQGDLAENKQPPKSPLSGGLGKPSAPAGDRKHIEFVHPKLLKDLAKNDII